MARGIQIEFVSDVSKFIAGTDNIERALDEVADSLDEVGREGEQAGKKAGDGLKGGVKDGARDAERATEDVADGFDDVGREGKKAGDDAGKGLGDGIEDGASDAERALKDVEDTAKRELDRVGEHAEDAGEQAEKSAEGLERKFRESFDTVNRESKTSGDTVGRNVKRGMDEGERATETFKQEAGQNFSETMSSFDGSLEGLLDGIQGTFGGIVADLGPAGMIGGAFVAAGIGLGVAFLQQSADKAAEVKEQVIALADAINEAGGNINEIDWAQQFRDFGNEIADPKSWFEPWQEASRTNAEIIAEDAERLGLTYETMFRAMAGDSESATLAVAEVNGKIAELNRQLDAEEDRTSATALELVKKIEQYREQRDVLQEAAGQTEQAIELEELHRQAIEGSEAAIEVYNEQMEEKLELLQEEADLNMSAAEAAAAWAQQTMDNANALDELNELIDTSTEATREATDAVTDGGNALDLYTEAGQHANETLIGTAEAGWDMIEAAREQGASTDELRAKTQTARDEFVKVAEQMGLTRGAAKRMADEYGLVPSQIETTAVLHTDTAMSRLGALDRTLNSINGREVSATVALRQTGNAAMNSGGQIGPGAASGRYISGQGSDIDDRVLTPTSPGEFVVDAQATQRIGVGNLQALNEGMPLGQQQPAQQPPINLTVYLGDEQITDRMRVVVDDVLRDGARHGRRLARAAGLG